MFVELTYEFYSTFSFDTLKNFNSNTPKLVKFCLINHMFELSLTEFNVALKFFTGDNFVDDALKNCVCDYCEPFLSECDKILGEISRDTSQFNLGRSKGILLKDNAL